MVNDKKGECEGCGKWQPEDEYSYYEEYGVYLCPDCLSLKKEQKRPFTSISVSHLCKEQLIAHAEALQASLGTARRLSQSATVEQSILDSKKLRGLK